MGKDSPAKQEALRNMRRRFNERGWRAVLKTAEEGGHVSLGRLLHLMSRGGVPDFAGGYAADRFSRRISPVGHPSRPPLDPGDLDTIWYHFDGGTIPWSGVAARTGVASLLPSQFVAVEAIEQFHARYLAFRMKGEPRQENKLRLRRVKSQGVWRVKDPKGEARRRVARAWSKVNPPIQPSTLVQWERRVRAWRRQAEAWRENRTHPGPEGSSSPNPPD